MGITLSVAAGAYVISILVLSHATIAREHAEARLDDTRSLFFHAAQERLILQHYKGPFDRMRTVGLIDGKAQSQWEALLRGNAADLRLPSFDFQIKAGSPLPGWSGIASPQVIATPMTLNLGLVHEGQLVHLLKRLRSSPSALVWARDCDLERTEGERPFQPAKENLHAQCVLLWLTVLTPRDNGKEATQ